MKMYHRIDGRYYYSDVDELPGVAGVGDTPNQALKNWQVIRDTLERARQLEKNLEDYTAPVTAK